MRTLLCLALFCGCEKKEVPAPAPPKMTTPAASAGPTLQVRMGGGANDVEPKLAFTVTHVYEHQKPAAKAPWHEPGGDWTYADCALDGAPAFTIGLTTPAAKGDFPMSFGKAELVAPDQKSGARFVEAFARAFHVAAPPAAAAQNPLAPLKMSTAVLGQNVDCGDDGCGGSGHFIATKLFLERGKRNGEVFFDIDPVGKKGFFAQKDADYNADVAGVLAETMR